MLGTDVNGRMLRSLTCLRPHDIMNHTFTRISALVMMEPTTPGNGQLVGGLSSGGLGELPVGLSLLRKI